MQCNAGLNLSAWAPHASIGIGLPGLDAPLLDQQCAYQYRLRCCLIAEPMLPGACRQGQVHMLSVVFVP